MKRAAQAETLRRLVSTRMPTRWGTFQTLGFERKSNGSARVETALAIVMGDVRQGAPLLRIHSQCFTSEVLGSLRCDCGEQLELAMRAIAEEGSGLVIYEHQEGRGIGLMAKLRAYALQDRGFDTVEANHALGFASDYRDFTLPAAILRDLGINQVRLLSNNPQKARVVSDAGIEVVAQVPCEAAPNEHSLSYLRTKKEKLGHALTLGQTEITDPIDGNQFPFATIEDAIHEFRAGRMIVVVDDEDRENEGDLTMAAEMITPDAINFMATNGRGLICLAMTGERLDELGLHPMSTANSALGGTAFTVSIDVIGDGVTTGISASDRAQTIKMAADPNSYPEDFARPGHVFPLRARPGGVLERRGQTEAAVDLASLAGLQPAGVICEIINDDGTMSRLPDLIEFCKKHDLLMITVADLSRYRFDCDYEGALAAIDEMFPVCATIAPTNLSKPYATDAPTIQAELIG
ncbi:MAG: 3,4-dihydroxy-2-butanone-4-phosphate synthase [Pyrinomonadaceae bacterium]|nr:3,4-dihydroxy-2-butanone-4-phosphate synthase [Pyrinomonadaceae bacterium]